MPDNPSSSSLIPPDAEEQARLRSLNRTPKPYHHLSPELPYASDRFSLHDKSTEPAPPRDHNENNDNDDEHHTNPYLKDSSPASESGTEADDEHFLKGLPAPKTKWHKGLRGQEDAVSGATTPLPSPPPYNNNKNDLDYISSSHRAKTKPERSRPLDILRRNKNIVQRATEAAIVASLGLMVRSNGQVRPLMDIWDRGMTNTSDQVIIASLTKAQIIYSWDWHTRHCWLSIRSE